MSLEKQPHKVAVRLCAALKWTEKFRSLKVSLSPAGIGSLLLVRPHHGGRSATAALRWIMQRKGILASQRKGSGCVKSQTYQGAVTKYE